MEKLEPLTPGQEGGTDRPAAPQTVIVAAARKPLPVDKKDRRVWFFGWLWCALMWEVLNYSTFTIHYGARPGLGVTVAATAFFALVWGYLGPPKTGSGRCLLAGELLLGLTFALTSRNEWFRSWNLLFLIVLAPVVLYEWQGGQGYPWSDPRMTVQRWFGSFLALFQNMGVNVDLAVSIKVRKHKKMLWVLAGLVLAAGLAVAVVPLLAAADALFDQILGQWMDLGMIWLLEKAGRWLLWLVLGAVAIPFVMSLLYSLRHPDLAPLPKVEGKGRTAEPALWITVLAVLDGLYLLFLGVQSVALFGGADYLARSGISYADYARSGFFQLVWVVFLNLDRKSVV